MIKNTIKKLDVRSIIYRLIASWLVAGTCTAVFAAEGELFKLEYACQASFPLLLVAAIAAFAALTGLNFLIRSKLFDRTAVLSAAFCYLTTVLFQEKDFYLCFGVLLVWAFLSWYVLCRDGEDFTRIKFGKKTVIVFVCAAAAFYAIYVGGITLLRYYTYSNSTYDFGIFAQMFYYMKKTGLPFSTCERDTLLSHFAIHISPIYYLLLPFYFIFPDPASLQVMQALVVVSGVIPLYLLAKHFSFSPKAVIAVCLSYCFYPALLGGCFYDIHENMFLPPLLLWFFYFYEKQKLPLVYTFAFLTFLVKEDAPIYIACAALYFILSKRSVRHGIILFSSSVLYFVTALYLLNLQGYGAMTDRYKNFMCDSDLGLLSIFKTILTDPVYLIQQCFSEEKFVFFMLMLLPLGFLPLLNKKPSQMALLIPFLLINLMPNYVYQHSIEFQYIFGVSGIFFYLCVLNLQTIKGDLKRFLLVFMVAASFMTTASTMTGKLGMIDTFAVNYEEYQTLDYYIKQIPEDASVRASGYFVPKLSQRREIYDLDYHSTHDTDYVIFDLRGSREEKTREEREKFLKSGYEQVAYEKKLILVLKKSSID